MRDLYFFHDDNASFVDKTSDMNNYLRDDFDLTFVALEDALYIGLYKKFNSSYIELTTASGSDPSLTFEYSQLVGFNSLSVMDETKGFTRSGFISWDKDIDDWEAQSINGQSAYWVKITAASDFVASIRGFNIVFSNDDDLESVQREIQRLKYGQDISFIAYHVAARDEIIQSLRNSGYTTLLSGSQEVKDLTKWDIHNFYQLREASKYLTLSKINSDVSQNVDDKYFARSKEYINNFQEAFRLYTISLDRDDDGEKDTAENNFFRTVEVIKV